MNEPAVPDLGLGCWTIGDATFADLVDTAASHGFRRITVSPYMFASALAAGWTPSTMRARLAEAGLVVTMVDAVTGVFPGVPHPAELDAQLRASLGRPVLDAPDRATGLRAAAALGARSVNVTHHLGAPTPLDQLAEALADVARAAGEFGILVCVEFIAKTAIPDLATAHRVVTESGAQNARVLLDTFHHARGRGSVDDVRALPPGSIGAIQLSDHVPPEQRAGDTGFAGRWLPGEGTLPLVELVRAALANNSELTIDLEVINTELAALDADTVVARVAAAATRWRASYART